MEKNTEKKRGITGTAQVAFLAMICCVLWGSAFPCVKIGYELFAVADEGRLMPPKSTWFEPKLRSGLFIHALQQAEG